VTPGPTGGTVVELAIPVLVEPTAAPAEEAMPLRSVGGA